MKRAIFHTTHCGSTLLANLLANSICTQSEPPWSEEYLKEKKVAIDLSQHKDNTLVKYPSTLCYWAPVFEGPSVFIYRPLKEHIMKVMNGRQFFYIDWHYDYYKLIAHPLLEDFIPDTRVEKHIYMWLNRVLYCLDSSNVLLVKAHDFFSQTRETTDKICEHFDCPPVVDFSLKKINVKHANLTLTDKYLHELQPEIISPVSSSYGIVSTFGVDQVSYGRETVMWIEKFSKIDPATYDKIKLFL